MQLAEEGKLTLEDPLRKWLPDYPNITNTVTIRQLLNHTSGIYSYIDNPVLISMVKTNTIYTTEDMLRLVKGPLFSPGKNYSYCTTGYLLLGLIAEKATGHPIAVALLINQDTDSQAVWNMLISAW